MCTLAGTQVLRYYWGLRRTALRLDIDLPGSAAGGLALLERASAAWINVCAGLSDPDLNKPLCDWPGDPQGHPFAETCCGPTAELIAAGDEIHLRRELSRPG